MKVSRKSRRGRKRPVTHGATTTTSGDPGAALGNSSDHRVVQELALAAAGLRWTLR
jgi:hypothetical protein